MARDSRPPRSEPSLKFLLPSEDWFLVAFQYECILASSVAQIECVQGIPVLTISERLDANTAPGFDSQTVSLHIEPWARILLDLSANTYLSSVGLRSMIKLIKHTSSCGGHASLFFVPGPIMKLIGISGFQPLLDIHLHRKIALKGGAA